MTKTGAGLVVSAYNQAMPIPIRKIFWILLSISLLLAAAHLWVTLAPPVSPSGFRYDALISAFDMENEANLPNWFSTVLLFATSLAGWLVYRLRSGAKWRFFWLIFAGIFLLLSLEEAASLREVLYHTFFIKSFATVYIPAGLALLVLFGGYFLIIERNNRPLQRWIIGGLLALVLGGLGGVLYPDIVVLKEWLELLGEILVLCACLGEINRLRGEI
jgi:hypothetical protein